LSTKTPVSSSTRDRILDTTAEVIRNLGLARTTTREIAQAAGLSEAALYRHFADKSDLFLCVIGERLPQLIAALRDLPTRVGQRSVRANLEEIGYVALPFYRETIPIVTSLFSEPELLERHRAELRSKNAGPQRSIEMLASYLRAEQKAGRINPKIDPEAVASLLLGACIGKAMMQRFLGETASAEADEKFVRNLVRTLLTGLAPAEQG
jgi:AcrR family transcriptional regulator